MMDSGHSESYPSVSVSQQMALLESVFDFPSQDRNHPGCKRCIKKRESKFFKANFAVALLGHKVTEVIPDSDLRPFEIDYDCMSSAFSESR